MTFSNTSSNWRVSNTVVRLMKILWSRPCVIARWCFLSANSAICDRSYSQPGRMSSCGPAIILFHLFLLRHRLHLLNDLEHHPLVPRGRGRGRPGFRLLLPSRRWRARRATGRKPTTMRWTAKIPQYFLLRRWSRSTTVVYGRLLVHHFASRRLREQVLRGRTWWIRVRRQ